ncbi:hypothetical protein ABBQ38_008116 [Trebouxia sp. C0009 RCD-2024]
MPDLQDCCVICCLADTVCRASTSWKQSMVRLLGNGHGQTLYSFIRCVKDLHLVVPAYCRNKAQHTSLAFCTCTPWIGIFARLMCKSKSCRESSFRSLHHCWLTTRTSNGSSSSTTNPAAVALAEQVTPASHAAIVQSTLISSGLSVDYLHNTNVVVL